MKLFALITLFLTSATFQSNQNDVAKLEKLIKKLGSKDPTTREQNQAKIVELISQTKKEELKPLVDEIKIIIKKDDDPEVTARLKHILSLLSYGEWLGMRSSPLQGRTGHICLLTRNKVIIFGGKSRLAGPYNDGAIYDIDKNSWKKMKKGPLAERYESTAAVKNNKLYIWGGKKYGRKLAYDGAIYDIKKDSWVKMKQIPFEPPKYLSIVLDNKIFVWSPSQAYIESNKGHHAAIYDMEKDEWMKKKIPKCPINVPIDSSKRVSGKKLIIWGGGGPYGFKLSDKGVIYDLERNNWLEISKSPIRGRWGHSATIAGYKMIVWGGYTQGKKPQRRGVASLYDKVITVNDGAIYDIEKDTWIKMSPSPIEKRTLHTGVYINEKFVVWGGRSIWPYPEHLIDGAIYDIKTDSWYKLESWPLNPRYGHTCLIINDSLIIWGGRSTKSRYRNALNNGAIYILPVIKAQF